MPNKKMDETWVYLDNLPLKNQEFLDRGLAPHVCDSSKEKLLLT